MLLYLTKNRIINKVFCLNVFRGTHCTWQSCLLSSFIFSFKHFDVILQELKGKYILSFKIVVLSLWKCCLSYWKNNKLCMFGYCEFHVIVINLLHCNL